MTGTAAEKMISLWWSKSSAPVDPACQEWIEESYTHVAPFWEDLFAFHHKRMRAPVASTLGERYDFYHDCILRHLASNAIAYTYVDKSGMESWTYKDLHQCVNYHVGKWEKYQVQPNQLALIALKPGSAFLTAFFTALRLGLKFCFLPLDTEVVSNPLVAKIAGEMAPQFLITDLDRGLAPPGVTQLTIETAKRDDTNHAPVSFAYPAATAIQTTLALHRQNALTFVPLDAQTMYLSALRDALISLNLVEHPSWAAPLSCPVATEPCSTLATQLAGARRFEVSSDDLMANPQLLKNEKIFLLGVNQALQKLWTRNPGASSYVEAWYKAPFEMFYHPWKTFLQVNKLDKALFYHLLMDNSLGGAILHSKPQLENYDYFMKCVPGTPWKLNDVGGSPVQATPGFGIFCPKLALEANQNQESNFLLSEVLGNCALSGSKVPCRQGFTFPIRNIETLVDTLPFVEGGVVAPLANTGGSMDKKFVLLVFVNPLLRGTFEQNKSLWQEEILSLIKKDLGKNYLPDSIELFPLIPRLKAQAIDKEWCISHYLSGGLKHKMESPSYQILHTLKKLAASSKSLSS